MTDGLAYSISPRPSNIHTRSGESSTTAAIRAADRALASASPIVTNTDATVPSSRRAERIDSHTM